MPHSVHPSPRQRSPEQDDISRKYWNVNVPTSEWTTECPAFLVGSSEKDQRILATSDADYVYQTWKEVKELINANRLDLFRRLPSNLRQYRKYIFDLKRSHGSVLVFVQHERLRWENVTPSGDTPFTNFHDHRILYNDWPYGVEADTKHLVVWTKFPLEEDSETGDLTWRARDEVQAFLIRTFCGEEGVTVEQVVWFKNWTSLKSIHALEHFHVLLHKAPEEFLERITKGDKPVSTADIAARNATCG